MEQHTKQTIIPLTPNWIIGKLRIGVMEISWAQSKILAPCSILTTIILSATNENWWKTGIGLITVAIIWVGVFKYARSHEILSASKMKLAHRIRKLRKLDRFSSIQSADTQIAELYRYNIKKISKNGTIHFGKNRFGVILSINTRWMDEQTLDANLIKIQGLLNSILPGTLIKIKTTSQIPYMNPMEAMVLNKINGTKSAPIKALWYSLHDLSSKHKKMTEWTVKIFMSFKSTESEVETRILATVPGILGRLQAANTVAAIITDEYKILNIFANDNTCKKIKQNQLPAMYSDTSIWKNRLRQIMQGSIKEMDDYVLINNSEYVSCIMVGIPVGGVSGFPPTINTDILTQIYRLSTSDEHIIRIDQSIEPIPSPIALKEILKAIKLIELNEHSLSTNKTALYDMGLDMSDLKTLYAQIKDGKECMFNITFIISVSSNSENAMRTGLSKVTAILGANNIMNWVPNNQILKTIQSTQFLPYYDSKSAIWMPTSGLARIIPLVSGANTITSTEGTYIGNEAYTDNEIIIDLDKLGAKHTLMIGATRSGKTTAMSLTGIRTILDDKDAIYITNKPDLNTNYRAVAEYFRDISQVINLGRHPDGSISHNVNPMEIIVDNTQKFDSVSKFYEHVGVVKFFINLLTGGDRPHKQLSYIEETIIELYAKFGILPDDYTTWNANPQPTLIDLYKIWQKDHIKYPADSTIEAIFSRTSSLNNTLKWLSNSTNVDFTKQYTVIDLSALPEDIKEAMNYLLTAVLALRFNIYSKRKTTIMIDEAGVLLKSPRLQNEFSRMLKQAGSYGVRIILGSQQLSDLQAIGPELRANIFISEVYGLNIEKNIDEVTNFFKLSNNDRQFLLSCSKPGMCTVSIGYPYATTYHIEKVLSELESQILFGKQEKQVAFSFVHPKLETFAEEQGVILSDWINGDTTTLRQERLVEWTQRAIGSGKVFAYIERDRINSNLILNQSFEHYLSVVQIAAYFIERNINVEVNHYEDADVVAFLPDGAIAFEYQTTGNNDPKKLLEKRKYSENKYGRLFFVGNTNSAKEIVKAIGTDEIVLSRGTKLEDKIKELTGEKTTQ